MELTRAWGEANHRVLRMLAPRGWLLSPSLAAGDVFAILELHEREGIDVVKARLVAYFTPERCTEILAETYAHRAFQPWGVVPQKAMRAHGTADYELAIPIWLISIEGIWRAQLSIPDPYKSQLSKADRRKIDEMLVGQRSTVLPFVNALIAVMAIVGGQVGRRALDDVIKRHGVLHGLKPTMRRCREGLDPANPDPGIAPLLP